MTAGERSSAAAPVRREGAPAVVIRRAGVADAATIAALGARTFHETFAADNRPEDMVAYLASTYSEAKQRRELESLDVTYLLGEIDGEPAAYAMVRASPPPPGVATELKAAGGGVELARFYVDSPFHGRGIAPVLMDAVVAEATRRGASALWLDVWERNPRAIRFYEKAGFRDVGGQPFQLGSDVQQDRVMLKEVPRQSGQLEAIWMKRMKRGPMDPVTTARLVTGRGIAGNANQGGRRQVTIVERELWETVMRELNADLPPSRRRANLMISGVSLAGMRGRVLRIGECRIRIYNELKPCYQMEDALPGLEAVMRPNWRGGAFGEVLDDGEIRVGDAVFLEPEPA